MWLLVICVSNHGAVGWSAVYEVVILTYFMNVFGDRELTKVALGMRRDFYSVMPNHKEASCYVIRRSRRKRENFIGRPRYALTILPGKTNARN